MPDTSASLSKNCTFIKHLTNGTDKQQRNNYQINFNLNTLNKTMLHHTFSSPQKSHPRHTSHNTAAFNTDKTACRLNGLKLLIITEIATNLELQ